MDEIKQRLTEASEACIKAYEAWRAKNTDAGVREGLLDAVHELRKVAARLEIELAVSERKQHGSDPIPIPSHRASRRQGPAFEGSESFDDDARPARPQGNGGPSGNTLQGGNVQRRPMQSLRRSPENSAAPAAETAAASGESSTAPAAPSGDEEGGQRRPRPLSLRRSAPESDHQG